MEQILWKYPRKTLNFIDFFIPIRFTLIELEYINYIIVKWIGRKKTVFMGTFYTYSHYYLH